MAPCCGAQLAGATQGDFELSRVVEVHPTSSSSICQPFGFHLAERRRATDPRGSACDRKRAMSPNIRSSRACSIEAIWARRCCCGGTIGGEVRSRCRCGVKRLERGAGLADKGLLLGDEIGPRLGAGLGLGARSRWISRAVSSARLTWSPAAALRTARSLQRRTSGPWPPPGREISSRHLVRKRKVRPFSQPFR